MFAAKYLGHCATCEDFIEVGDQVHYVDGVLLHESCEAPLPETTAAICTVCNLSGSLNADRMCPDCAQDADV